MRAYRKEYLPSLAFRHKRQKGFHLPLILLVLMVPLCHGTFLYGIPPKIGLITGESALQTSEAWSILVAFIEERFGIPLQFEVYDGHRPLLKALKERWIDLALIDSAWYVRERQWVRPLLQTVIEGQREYPVLLIVQRNSIFYRTSELRGFELFLKRPHEEMAGFYLPLATLSSFLPVHRESIRFLDTYQSILKVVAYGRGVEVGAIPEYVWNQNRGSHTREYLRVLEALPPVPTPLVVMRASDDEARFRDVIRVLSTLHTTEPGKQILERTSFSGFTTERAGDGSFTAFADQIRQVDVLYGPPE